MSLEDDIARQAFHVEQLEAEEKILKQLLKECHGSRLRLFHRALEDVQYEIKASTKTFKALVAKLI